MLLLNMENSLALSTFFSGRTSHTLHNLSADPVSLSGYLLNICARRTQQHLISPLVVPCLLSHGFAITWDHLLVTHLWERPCSELRRAVRSCQTAKDKRWEEKPWHEKAGVFPNRSLKVGGGGYFPALFRHQAPLDLLKEALIWLLDFLKETHA